MPTQPALQKSLCAVVRDGGVALVQRRHMNSNDQRHTVSRKPPPVRFRATPKQTTIFIQLRSAMPPKIRRSLRTRICRLLNAATPREPRRSHSAAQTRASAQTSCRARTQRAMPLRAPGAAARRLTPCYTCTATIVMRYAAIPVLLLN